MGCFFRVFYVFRIFVPRMTLGSRRFSREL
jgi:hypothetical protein